MVLGLVKVDGSDESEREFYLKVARTVVDVFLRGLGARS